MPSDSHSDLNPYQAVISRVVGRGAQDGGAGLPLISDMEFVRPDGEAVSGSVLPVGPTVRRDRAIAVCEIHKSRFVVCPICLSGGALSDEHVPPRRFGGSVMTQTCTRCNSTFGSWAEASMLDWFDQSVRVIYRTEDDPRPLADGRVVHLRTAEGEVVMVPQMSGSMPSAMTAQLREGRAVIGQMRPHALAEIQNGMLKNAYLAAGLHLGGLPDVPSVHEIRRELVGVVEAPSRADIIAGPHAARIRFHRTGAAASGPPLALMRTEGDEPIYLISLAGTILVDWPFPEIDPGEFVGRVTR